MSSLAAGTARIPCIGNFSITKIATIGRYVESVVREMMGLSVFL
jgi:hypothetical protein